MWATCTCTNKHREEKKSRVTYTTGILHKQPNNQTSLKGHRRCMHNHGERTEKRTATCPSERERERERERPGRLHANHTSAEKQTAGQGGAQPPIHGPGDGAFACSNALVCVPEQRTYQQPPPQHGTNHHQRRDKKHGRGGRQRTIAGKR